MVSVIKDGKLSDVLGDAARAGARNDSSVSPTHRWPASSVDDVTERQAIEAKLGDFDAATYRQLLTFSRMNLAVNARDAMARPGQLRIETSAFETDGRYALAHKIEKPFSTNDLLRSLRDVLDSAS